jgi:hypothetical protein
MKNLKTHLFDAKKCRQEWCEFDDLLKVKPRLEERRDVLPFFKERHNLSMLICNYFPKLVEPNTFAHEYEIYGDFVADLIVIGKDMQLLPQEQDRLNWRLDRTLIDSNAISCVSFNGLCKDFDYWLKNYYSV